MTVAQQVAINDFMNDLNRYIAEAATRAGIDWVDTSSIFDDHGLCVDESPDPYGDGEGRWVNRFQAFDETGIRWGDTQKFLIPEGTNESVHPNIFGQEAYYQAILACYSDRSRCGKLDAPPPVNIAAFDWKAITYPLAGCLTREAFSNGDVSGQSAQSWDAETVNPVAADVTGDGLQEVVVTLQCPASTSSWPDVGFVFDITKKEPKLILTIDDLYFRGATAETGDGFIAMSGPTVSEGDTLGGAKHWGSVRYAWNGTDFDQVSLVEVNTSQPIQWTGISDGTHWGYLRGSTADQLFLDDEIPSRVPGACGTEPVPAACNNYQYEVDDLVRAVRVAPHAVLLSTDWESLNTISTPYSESATALREGQDSLYRVVVVGGQVMEMEQHFYWD